MSQERALEPPAAEMVEGAGLRDEPEQQEQHESEVDEDDPEFEQSRNINDQRLKSRFEHIFEKYARDFTGVGDEIDMDTGEIVVDNGHLANMQHEGDAGEGESLAFLQNFKENLEHEDEDEGSSEEESGSGEDESGSEDEREEDGVEYDLGDGLGYQSTAERDSTSRQSSAEADIPIDPLLMEPTAAATAEPVPALPALADGASRSASEQAASARPTPDSGTPSVDSGSQSGPSLDVMNIPGMKESLKALKNAKSGGDVDQDVIDALGTSIANKIAHFIGSSKAKAKSKAKSKRKESTWDYPELPEFKRRRLEVQTSRSRLQLEQLSSVLSPQRMRKEPRESLWAPAHHPKPMRPKRKKTQGQPTEKTDVAEGEVQQPAADTTAEDANAQQTETAEISLKTCYNCNIRATTAWRCGPDGDLCNACGMYLYRYGLMKPPRPATPENEPVESSDEEERDHSHYSANTSRRMKVSRIAGQRNGTFTIEEEALIIKLKELDNLSWEQIGRYFEGRSFYSLQCRYSKCLQPSLGPTTARDALVEQGFNFADVQEELARAFNEEQDELLVQLREESEMEWSAIAERLPNKTAETVEERYNILLGIYPERPRPKKRPNPKYGKNAEPNSHSRAYTAEEDELLIKLREVDKLPWEILSQEFIGRTWLSLQKRYVRTLAQRQAIIREGGNDPYMHLFIDEDEDMDIPMGPAGRERLAELLQKRKEEDEEILRLRDQEGMNFADISAQHMQHRTVHFLENRYRWLKLNDGSMDVPAPTSPEHAEAAAGPVSAAEATPAAEPTPAVDSTAAVDPTLAENTTTSAAPTPAVEPTTTAESPMFNTPDSWLPPSTVAEAAQAAMQGGKKKGGYTYEDDKLIFELRVVQRLDWPAIARSFQGRTPYGIEQRYRSNIRINPAFERRLAALPKKPSPKPKPKGRRSRYIDPLLDTADGEDEDGEGTESGEGTERGHYQPKSSRRSRKKLTANFSKEEHDLVVALRDEGKGWTEIAEQIPGRTPGALASYWALYIKEGGMQNARQAQFPNLADSRRPYKTLLQMALDNNGARRSGAGPIVTQLLDQQVHHPGPMNLFNTLCRNPAASPAKANVPEEFEFDFATLGGEGPLGMSPKKASPQMRGLLPSAFVSPENARQSTLASSPLPVAAETPSKAREVPEGAGEAGYDDDDETENDDDGEDVRMSIEMEPQEYENEMVYEDGSVSVHPSTPPVYAVNRTTVPAQANPVLRETPARVSGPYYAATPQRPFTPFVPASSLRAGTPFMAATPAPMPASTPFSAAPAPALYSTPARYSLAMPYFVPQAQMVEASPPLPTSEHTQTQHYYAAQRKNSEDEVVTPAKKAAASRARRSQTPARNSPEESEAEAAHQATSRRVAAKTTAPARHTRGRPQSSPQSPGVTLRGGAPPFSWNDLIAMALKSSPLQQMDIHDIHLYLEDKFPYFRACGQGWKTTLRGHLTGSSDFEKVPELAATYGFRKAYVASPPKRKPGRPRKVVESTALEHEDEETVFEPQLEVEEAKKQDDERTATPVSAPPAPGGQVEDVVPNRSAEQAPVEQSVITAEAEEQESRRNVTPQLSARVQPPASVGSMVSAPQATFTSSPKGASGVVPSSSTSVERTPAPPPTNARAPLSAPGPTIPCSPNGTPAAVLQSDPFLGDSSAVKRGRGRPRKHPLLPELQSDPPPKRPRGRPPKEHPLVQEPQSDPPPKRPRGRPPKARPSEPVAHLASMLASETASSIAESSDPLAAANPHFTAPPLAQGLSPRVTAESLMRVFKGNANAKTVPALKKQAPETIDLTLESEDNKLPSPGLAVYDVPSSDAYGGQSRYALLSTKAAQRDVSSSDVLARPSPGAIQPQRPGSGSSANSTGREASPATSVARAALQPQRPEASTSIRNPERGPSQATPQATPQARAKAEQFKRPRTTSGYSQQPRLPPAGPPPPAPMVAVMTESSSPMFSHPVESLPPVVYSKSAHKSSAPGYVRPSIAAARAHVFRPGAPSDDYLKALDKTLSSRRVQNRAVSRVSASPSVAGTEISRASSASGPRRSMRTPTSVVVDDSEDELA